LRWVEVKPRDAAVPHISTSFTERQNLTMRMSMRRFTRLTNGVSKKLEQHENALALYFMFYNFCRIHQTVRVTSAMEAAVADLVWSLEEVIPLLAWRLAASRTFFGNRNWSLRGILDASKVLAVSAFQFCLARPST